MEITLALAALKLVGYGLSTIGPGLGIGIAATAAASPPLAARTAGSSVHELHHRCCSRRGSGPHRLRAYLHRVTKPHSDTVPYKAYIGGNVRES